MNFSEKELVSVVSSHAVQLRADEISDYDHLIESIGDAHFVLIGEASHGTHEFYRERAQITKRLIREKVLTYTRRCGKQEETAPHG